MVDYARLLKRPAQINFDRYALSNCVRAINLSAHTLVTHENSLLPPKNSLFIEIFSLLICVGNCSRMLDRVEQLISGYGLSVGYLVLDLVDRIYRKKLLFDGNI